jgi:hypothetical protein
MPVLIARLKLLAFSPIRYEATENDTLNDTIISDASKLMTEQFVPPGYVKVGDYRNTDEKSLRHRFASGELVAAVWNPHTGEVVEIDKDHWRADWSQTMIDKGTFRKVSGHGQSEVLPVLVRIDDGHNRSVSKPAYVSPFLQIMMDAAVRFNTSAGRNGPKKAELEAYFKKLKLPDGTPISTSQAKQMATFVRPPEAMKGGQKKVR